MYRQYREIQQGEVFVVAGDTASGGSDRTAIQFLSKTKLDIPLVFQSPVTTSDALPQLAMVLDRIYDVTKNKPTVGLERNNGGSFLMDRLAGMNYGNKYEIFKMPRKGNVDEQEAIKLGWETSSATRPIMLQEFKDAVDKKVITIYDKPTIHEMFSFVVVQTATAWKAQAEHGAHDDLVMSAAIVWQMNQNVIIESPIFDEDIPDDTGWVQQL